MNDIGLGNNMCTTSLTSTQTDIIKNNRERVFMHAQAVKKDDDRAVVGDTDDGTDRNMHIKRMLAPAAKPTDTNASIYQQFIHSHTRDSG